MTDPTTIALTGVAIGMAAFDASEHLYTRIGIGMLSTGISIKKGILYIKNRKKIQKEKKETKEWQNWLKKKIKAERAEEAHYAMMIKANKISREGYDAKQAHNTMMIKANTKSLLKYICAVKIQAKWRSQNARFKYKKWQELHTGFFQLLYDVYVKRPSFPDNLFNIRLNRWTRADERDYADEKIAEQRRLKAWEAEFIAKRDEFIRELSNTQQERILIRDRYEKRNCI